MVASSPAELFIYIIPGHHTHFFSPPLRHRYHFKAVDVVTAPIVFDFILIETTALG